MKFTFAAAIGLVLASAGAASAQSYYSGPTPAYAAGAAYSAAAGYAPACPTGWHPGGGGQACICDYPANFYPGYPGSGGPGGYGPGGYGPGGPGYDIHVQAPGARIIGTPVTIASGTIYVDGPPIYVQAPPVHVQAPTIYLRRPQVVVQPSQVTVDAPNVQTEPCPEGSTCEGTVGQSYSGGSQRYRTARR